MIIFFVHFTIYMCKRMYIYIFIISRSDMCCIYILFALGRHVVFQLKCYVSSTGRSRVTTASRAPPNSASSVPLPLLLMRSLGSE